MRDLINNVNLLSVRSIQNYEGTWGAEEAGEEESSSMSPEEIIEIVLPIIFCVGGAFLFSRIFYKKCMKRKNFPNGTSRLVCRKKFTKCKWLRRNGHIKKHKNKNHHQHSNGNHN